MAETLRGLEAGSIKLRAQDHAQATFAPQLKKDDGRINWDSSATQIYNRIRGFEPWPGAYTLFRGQKCAIWGKPFREVESFEGAARGTLSPKNDEWLVTCGEGTFLRLEFVQLEGRKKVSARDFSIGARIVQGEQFGE